MRLPLVRVVLVAVVAMMAVGQGLSGWVHMLAPSSHVCTCTSGGSHADCPVCNPRLAAKRTPSPVRAIDGLPCGDRHGAIESASEPALLPVASVASAPAFTRVEAPRASLRVVVQVSLEPSTPPPRNA